MQKILQLIADEISANTDFKAHKNQKIPLYDNPEMYDTEYVGTPTYSSQAYKTRQKEINQIWKDRDDGIITQEEALEKVGAIEGEIEKIVYPKVLLRDCAGLGDNDAIITVHKKPEELDSKTINEMDKVTKNLLGSEGYFTLNIGNNDISENKTEWVEKIKEMGIQVEEAECDESLDKIARDCTCGIIYGFGGPDRELDENEAEKQRKETKKMMNELKSD